MVNVTYYVDTLSSWCLIAEDAVAKIRAEFGSRITFNWKVVALNEGAPFNDSPAKFGWFYRRTHAVTGTQLNAAWHTSMQDGSLYGNLAAEAARTLGVADDSVRTALSCAALLHGKRVPDREIAVAIAAEAGGLAQEVLSEAMDDPRTLATVVRATMELRALPVSVIPCFVIENAVNDRAILSGLYGFDAIAGVIREMLDAAERYRTFMSANPEPTV